MLTADWLINSDQFIFTRRAKCGHLRLRLSKYKNKVYKLATPLAGRLLSSEDLTTVLFCIIYFLLEFRILPKVLKEICDICGTHSSVHYSSGDPLSVKLLSTTLGSVGCFYELSGVGTYSALGNSKPDIDKAQLVT